LNRRHPGPDPQTEAESAAPPDHRDDDQRVRATEEARSSLTESSEHFGTDHLVANLAARAVSGGFVTVGSQAAKFALNLISAAVLARLVTPEEFGVVGMVLAVTVYLGLFKEAGLSTATIQRDKVTQAQVSNLFWINVALSGLVAALSVVLAPLVAWFYRDSRIVDVMVALSFTFVLTGSTVQHNALLVRQMRFRAIAIIEILSLLAGIITGASMALLHFGYWSLVGMQLCIAASALVLTWGISQWRPSLPRRGTGVAPLLKFGAHLTASDLVGRLAARADGLLIGRYFGAAPLGLYSRANILLARPLEQILSPISAVVIPVLSRLQSDPDRYRQTYLRAYDTLALITLPCAALFFVLAEPLVLLILGSDWRDAAPLFAGFALVAVTLPLSVAGSWLYLSQGRGSDLFRTYSATGAVTVAAIVVGLRWGPLGVVLALAVATLTVRMPIIYYLAGRRGPVRTADLWRRFLCHAPTWAVVCAVTALAHATVEEASPIMQLLVCVPIGLAAAAATILALRLPRSIVTYLWKNISNSLRMQWSRAA